MKTTLPVRLLRRAGHGSLVLPLTLGLRLEGSQVEKIQLEKVLRLLPGRRLVALGRWRGREVVAKVFFSNKGWRRHLRRELDGVAALRKAGIRSPELLQQAELVCRAEERDEESSSELPLLAGAVLLFDYLDDSVSVGDYWLSLKSAEARLELLGRVVKRIAACHRLGLQQKDIHLDNFLLRHGELYQMDAGSISLATGNDFEQNLALFCAQFPAEHDRWLDEVRRVYIAEAGDRLPPLEDFRTRVRETRQQRLRLLMGKLYRNTSAHECRQNLQRFVVYRRERQSAELEEFIQDPNAFMERGRVLKRGNSSTVVVLKLGAREVTVKRYNIKNTLHGLRRLTRPSRAWISWGNAHRLQMLGIDTPAPWLMLERRLGPLRREAWFVCDYVQGPDALQLLGKEPINSAPWSWARDRFEALFRTMKDYRLVHGDMKATNFICADERLYVIDLDAMFEARNSQRFARAFGRDLQRFLRNWRDNETVSAAIQELIARVKRE